MLGAGKREASRRPLVTAGRLSPVGFARLLGLQRNQGVLSKPLIAATRPQSSCLALTKVWLLLEALPLETQQLCSGKFMWLTKSRFACEAYRPIARPSLSSRATLPHLGAAGNPPWRDSLPGPCDLPAQPSGMHEASPAAPHVVLSHERKSKRQHTIVTACLAQQTAGMRVTGPRGRRAWRRRRG